MSYEQVIDNILANGADDWVPLVVLVRQFDATLAGEALLRSCISVVEEGLTSGWVMVGDLNPRFVAWPLTTASVLARIEQEWRALGRAPELGEICWLANTPAGNERARQSGLISQ